MLQLFHPSLDTLGRLERKYDNDLVNSWLALAIFETLSKFFTEKKHKNGKDVKNEHGYTMYETVGEEKNTTAFKQCDSFIFHLFRNDA